MALIQQADRLLSVATPLGEDKLLLAGFTGGEALSRLFSYQLDLLSEDEEIDPSAIVGQNITWRVQYLNGEPRFFNGYVSRFAASSVLLRNLRVYRAEVVPWLWFLTRTSDCRIWEQSAPAKKTAADIVEMVFQEFGFKKAYDRSGIKGPHAKREYCVQYRETAFNFVSRLMEEEGIFYYFRHEDGAHTLVLADHNGAYTDCPEKEVEHGPTRRGPGLVNTWDHQFSFRSGKWAQTDYNFETPSTNLLSTAETLVPQPGEDAYELFDYPGNYRVTSDGKTLTDIRMQEEEVPYDVVSGTGGCTTFSPGGKFTLTKHEVTEEEGNTYVLTAVQHVAKEYGYFSSTRGGEYSNSFSCIRSAVTFRPARLTIKPTVQGPQTAVVVGPRSEEIYTDKYGRVKVQFFWDRRGKKDENSSCWIRVAQNWAGKRWGAFFWPRIGQEVIVDFLEGDPDQPIIVGSVYNAEQMPPYLGDGPDAKHKKDNKVSGIKTNTTPGGVGFNELRFDDTKGTEQVFIHAEHNMDTRVKNDAMERVYGNRHLIVGWEKDGQKGGDQRELVYQDKHLHVDRHQVEQIEGNLLQTIGKGDAQDGGNVDIIIEKVKKELIEKDSHLHVKGSLMEKIDPNYALTVGGDMAASVGGKFHVQVKGDRNEKVDGTQSLTVGQNQQEKVGQNHALDAGMEIHLKAGMKVIIEAGMQLSLKGPGGFIDIGPSGVSIQGIMVLINSGGAAGSGSGSSPQTPEAPKAPEDAKKAEPTKPAVADDAKTGFKSAPG